MTPTEFSIVLLLTGALCMFAGGLIMDIVWTRKFARCVMTENKRREDTIKQLNKTVDHHKADAAEWRSRARAALLALNDASTVSAQKEL